MSAQISVITQIIVLFIVFNLNIVFGVKRDQKHNLTLDKNSIPDTERDSRQFAPGYPQGFGDYGLSSFGGPLEAIIIGVLVVAGLGILGIPLLLLFFSLFNGGGFGGGTLGGTLGTGGIGGFNLVPTAGTATVTTGRKRREINSLLPEVNPIIQQKLFNAFESFIETPDKIKLIEKLLDSIVSRN